MKKRLPLYKIAKAAKVSPATVSRVAAGNPAVNAEIRERVLRTAVELGIDLEERRNGKNRTVAFLLGNREVLHSFQSRILSGAESYCSAQNWEMLFLSFRYQAGVPAGELHLPHILSRASGVRGVIVGGTNSPNLLEVLHERGIPFTVLGNNVTGEWESEASDVVYSDDVNGAYEATKYLIAAGHKEICYIGNSSFPWFRRCGEGYRRAMEEAELPARTAEILSDGQELGYLAAKSVFNQPPAPTAILAGSDQVAKGVYNALRESNIAIPQDMTVIGFNDTEAPLFYPALSSVREFPEELGRHLAEFLLNRIRKPSLPPQQITIPTQLVLRDSSRPLREAARAE